MTVPAPDTLFRQAERGLLPLGELFVLAPLAEDCARDGKYEFMVVSAPLHVEGGVATPPNAVVIK